MLFESSSFNRSAIAFLFPDDRSFLLFSSCDKVRFEQDKYCLFFSNVCCFISLRCAFNFNCTDSPRMTVWESGKTTFFDTDTSCRLASCRLLGGSNEGIPGVTGGGGSVDEHKHQNIKDQHQSGTKQHGHDDRIRLSEMGSDAVRSAYYGDYSGSDDGRECGD